ncbi:MAG TPA: M48 family metalloprotease [Saprospiraceae bacterium]|nr:M48 family metalloprotease [Saprospiraceae bacterium]
MTQDTITSSRLQLLNTAFILLLSCEVPAQAGKTAILQDSCSTYFDGIFEVISQRIVERGNESDKRSREFETYDQELIEWIKSRFDANEFVCTPEIVGHAEALTREIVHVNPDSFTEPIITLVSKDPSVNASSIGNETIILNAGLLMAMETKEEFLFVIAHEMGHDFLDHKEEMLKYSYDQYASKSHKEEVKEIIKKSGTKREALLNYFETLEIETKAFSQSNEFEADSVAMVFITSMIWDPSDASAALRRIHEYEPVSPDWKALLNFENYPFQASWLQLQALLVEPDTLDESRLALFSTHPHVDKRIAKLEGDYLSAGERNSSSYTLSVPLRNDLMIQSVEYLIDQERYLPALYTAMNNHNPLEPNEALCRLTGTIFHELYTLREVHTFSDHIPPPPATITDAYDELICILNKMRLRDLANTGFHFMNQYPFQSKSYNTVKTALKELLKN